MKNLIYLIAVLAMTSCSPKYYIPNTINTPMLTDKGETNITGAGKEGQYEFQVGHALGNNFGILANGSFFVPKDDEENGSGGEGRFFEVGAGYFKPLGMNFMFDVYGLIGSGRMENHFPNSIINNPNTEGRIEANVLRYGIQPGLGFKSKYFSAAFNPRIVMVNYSNIDGSLLFNGDQIAYLKEHNSNLMVEPTLTLRAGLEKVKLQFQIGSSINLTTEDFPQEKSFATIGLNFNFK